MFLSVLCFSISAFIVESERQLKISFEKGSNIANNTLSNIIFTPDNKHHAYLVSFNDIMTGGNSAYYVIDGIEGKHFNKVSPLEVSKETNQMTYWGLEVNGYGFMKNAYYKYVNGKQVEKTKHAPSHWDGY